MYTSLLAISLASVASVALADPDVHTEYVHSTIYATYDHDVCASALSSSIFGTMGAPATSAALATATGTALSMSSPHFCLLGPTDTS